MEQTVSEDKSGSIFPKDAKLREINGSFSPWNNQDNVIPGEKGLSKRELAAMMAMQGMLANLTLISRTGSDAIYINAEEKFSTLAVQAADALLAELSKERGE